jgi:hypothetical protein
MIGLIIVIAIPMIFLHGSQPPAKALLLRNYGANLTLLIGIIAVITLTLHAISVARERPAGPGSPRLGCSDGEMTADEANAVDSGDLDADQRLYCACR